MTDEATLRSAKAGDRDAAEKLVTENSGLIWSVARRFFGRGVDSDDLYQLGCVGFLKAIAGYDESYGTQGLEQRLGREPTLSELSAETGLTPEDIAVAETAAGPAESLQREAGEDGFTLEHLLSGEDETERVLERVSLREAIDRLPERERHVISLRYFHDMTQEAAARVLGVSQVQVSRLERRAISALRELLEP